eukprot:CAMPEP_0195269052 /NCGR_PEP_ID=MMETSP0706-20130129/13531_1 /TAXON_ID=33640 /ORGANISM="Asterionellopsis glacialis, Strain CCMP134" /LENGTH=46 /DNA_ID= /DNA_START= /DNA_END= /DNA_ORIENTATION=
MAIIPVLKSTLPRETTGDEVGDLDCGGISPPIDLVLVLDGGETGLP